MARQHIGLLRAFACGDALTPRATRFSLSVRVVIEANAIAAMAAGSECGSSNCGHLAADTRPPQKADRITASASNPIGNADVGLA